MARDFIPSAELEPAPTHARRHLPALAMPEGDDDRRVGAAASIALHVLIVLLLVTPIAAGHEIVERPQGAGGPGPAGGGGGGRRGTGGETEHLEFIRVAPPPPAPAAAVPTVQPKIVVPPPKPVVKPPEPVKPPQVEALTPTTKIDVAAKPLDVSAVRGVGGGTGNDGTGGSGPGKGGGVGSGEGTGRGSGVGPGTGGGNQANYPPTPTEVFLPPMPIPNSVKGFHLVAEFDVDETGRVLGFDFTHTKDGGYNRRLSDVFRSFRFRPGTRPDGTPIRMKAQVVVDLF